MSNEEKEAFWKVLKTIETAEYINFIDESLLNLINNFKNMYNCTEHLDILNTAYNEKLKQFKNN
jgi:hypothetical protein